MNEDRMTNIRLCKEFEEIAANKNIVLSKIKLGSNYTGLREEYKKRFKDISSGIS